MRRPFLLTLLALVLLTSFAGVLAAPPAAPLVQDQAPVIAEPAANSVVRGVVQVVGTATHPQFQRYELYYAPWPAPSDQSWVFIGDAHFNQQPLGLLGTWDSRSVPDGAYALRVRVVKADGNYLDSSARSVLVANTSPVESPTTEATATIESQPFPTEIPPTGAAVVEAPTIAAVGTVAVQVTETPAPEDLLEPTATGTRAAAGVVATRTPAGSNAGSITGELFGGSRLPEVARKAATYTLAVFAAVGVFFAIKALLVWLWYKVRP